MENDRIFLVPGDLRTGKALVEIGDLLKKLKIELNLLYLSNAEEFWSYTKEFRKSIINLPFGDQGLVLRTVVIGKKYAIGWKFHYSFQQGKDFVKWMQTPGSFSSKTIARKHRIPIDNKPYLSRFPAPPVSEKQ
ncbi:MAG: hypothetical protein PF689_04670 [Deltaproteobacteria bacterium]|nr:hypothetical protein [Deltaproteobacteria bacterium]